MRVKNKGLNVMMTNIIKYFNDVLKVHRQVLARRSACFSGFASKFEYVHQEKRSRKQAIRIISENPVVNSILSGREVEEFIQEIDETAPPNACRLLNLSLPQCLI